MASPSDLMYNNSTNEWIQTNADSNGARYAGTTAYEVGQIGAPTKQVVFSKNIGDSVNQGDAVATVTGSGTNPTYTFHAPAGGVISDRNEYLFDRPGIPGHPEAVGKAPYDTSSTGGWLVCIAIPNTATLPPSLVNNTTYDSTHQT